MKTVNINLSAIIAITSIIVGSLACRNKPEVINVIPDNIQLNNLYAGLALKPVNTNIDNALGGYIVGKGGSKLIIQPNSFISKTGSLISGDVQVAFTDWTNRADMIFSKVLPISDGEPLISGGEYAISATVAGQPVFLKPSKPIQVRLPQFGKDASGMQIFKGTIIPEVNNNTINWQLGDSVSGGTLLVNGDTISIFNDSCQTVNADRFITNPNYVEFNLTIAGAPITEKGFAAYCLYKDFNGCYPLEFKDANTYNATHIPDIACHLVVYGYHNNEFYSGILSNITPAMNVTKTINISKSDEVALVNAIKNL